MEAEKKDLKFSLSFSVPPKVLYEALTQPM
jgi:uncharacterized protein YndB with AHSA1/START domain